MTKLPQLELLTSNPLWEQAQLQLPDGFLRRLPASLNLQLPGRVGTILIMQVYAQLYYGYSE